MDKTIHRQLGCNGIALISVLAVLSLAVGCGTTELKPVDIFVGDICANCKMAISEKQYAAEFLDPDAHVFKFDDIQCMLRYLDKQADLTPAVFFVTDFDSRSWIRADKATLVRSSYFKTPMNGNLAAFLDQKKAKAAVNQYEGEMLTFDELLKP